MCEDLSDLKMKFMILYDDDDIIDRCDEDGEYEVECPNTTWWTDASIMEDDDLIESLPQL